MPQTRNPNDETDRKALSHVKTPAKVVIFNPDKPDTEWIRINSTKALDIE